MLIIQQRQAKCQRQQVEEVVVSRQNDENLKQHLCREGHTGFICFALCGIGQIEMSTSGSVHLRVKRSKSQPA